MRKAPDQVLELLQDGKPRTLSDIAEATHSSPRVVRKVLIFLLKYGFVKRTGRFVRSDDQFRTLMEEL